MNTAQLKEQTKKLPSKPGIYLFKNSKRKPLYIGKALNLKNRLKSYLKSNDPRLQQMISEAKKINFIKTDSDIEALILESQYVKKYKPDFNIMLRDDKQYGFVGFTEEEFPKIFLTHQPGSRNSSKNFVKQNSDAKPLEFSLPGKPTKNENFIGPFTDIGALKTTLRILRRIFPHCTCKQNHHNYCLNYHIGKCPGFCCLKQQNPNLEFKIESLKLYKKNLKAIKDILSGKKSSLIKNLEKEMKTLSSQQEYEKALELQHKIEKLRRIFLNALIINRDRKVMIRHNSSHVLKSLQKFLDLASPPRRVEAYDISNIQGKHAVGSMIVFENGKPNKNEYRLFKIRNKSQILNSKLKTISDFGFRASDFHLGGDTGMLKEVLIRRFNHPEWATPDLILVDGGRAQFNTAKNIVKNIPLIALTKNDKHIGHKILTDKTKEISLSKLSINVKNLLLQIDSEAHRFAVLYYRNLHRKNLKFKS